VSISISSFLGPDALAARADLYRRYAQFVVDIRIGPDVGAVEGFVFDLLVK
jgi:hypothetical protein